MKTLDRLEEGVDRISEAVDLLNELSKAEGLPLIALRCWDGKKWQSIEYFLGLVFFKQTDELLAQIAEIERAKGWKNFPEKEIT